MRWHRKLLLVLSLMLVGGSTGWTAWQGIRLRTPWYHRRIAADLSGFFSMPCELGRIESLTFSSRRFNDVRVWLPEHREHGPVFSCRQAIWHQHHRDGVPANGLELIDGVISLGSDGWQLGDYRQILQSGLGHNFVDLHLDNVTLSNFELAFRKGGFDIHCREAAGRITFPQPRDGVARLVAYELNGHPVAEGVQIDARFEPSKGVKMRDVYLDLPEVPLASMGLSVLEHAGAAGGSFSGRIEYHADGDAEPAVLLRGDLSDADLAAVTRGLPFGPLTGRVSISVAGARVSNATMTHLRGRGRVDGLALESLARLVGHEPLSGEANLNVQWIDLALGHVNELSLTGEAAALSVPELLELWGGGSATGTLAIKVNGLHVVKDRIDFADIEVKALPPADGPGTIDRSLLVGAAEKALGFSWPSWAPKRLIPDKIEYAECGVRLIVHENRLRIHGSHGERGDAILSIKLLGQTVELVKERAGSIDLSPWIDALLARARGYDPDEVRAWLKARAAATRPAP